MRKIRLPYFLSLIVAVSVTSFLITFCMIMWGTSLPGNASGQCQEEIQVRDADTRMRMRMRELNQYELEEFKQRRQIGYLDLIPLSSLEWEMRFLHVPDTPCPKELPMIILVTSACGNKNHRRAIRETWGIESRKLNVPVVFFVGQCLSAKQEMLTYGDIVEGNFVDSYYNNTLKTLSRHRWYKEHCGTAKTVLFADDDVLVNVDAILKFIPSMPKSSQVCFKVMRLSSNRYFEHKWYVPTWSRPEVTFPPYCYGPARLVASEDALKVYEAVLPEPYMQIDDALFTGIVARKAGVKVVNDRRFIMKRQRFSSCQISASFAAHSFVPEDMLEQWRRRMEPCDDTYIPERRKYEEKILEANL